MKNKSFFKSILTEMNYNDGNEPKEIESSIVYRNTDGNVAYINNNGGTFSISVDGNEFGNFKTVGEAGIELQNRGFKASTNGTTIEENDLDRQNELNGHDEDGNIVTPCGLVLNNEDNDFNDVEESGLEHVVDMMFHSKLNPIFEGVSVQHGGVSILDDDVEKDANAPSNVMDIPESLLRSYFPRLFTHAFYKSHEIHNISDLKNSEYIHRVLDSLSDKQISAMQKRWDVIRNSAITIKDSISFLNRRVYEYCSKIIKSGDIDRFKDIIGSEIEYNTMEGGSIKRKKANFDARAISLLKTLVYNLKSTGKEGHLLPGFSNADSFNVGSDALGNPLRADIDPSTGIQLPSYSMSFDETEEFIGTREGEKRGSILDSNGNVIPKGKRSKGEKVKNITYVGPRKKGRGSDEIIGVKKSISDIPSSKYNKIRDKFIDFENKNNTNHKDSKNYSSSVISQVTGGSSNRNDNNLKPIRDIDGNIVRDEDGNAVYNFKVNIKGTTWRTINPDLNAGMIKVGNTKVPHNTLIINMTSATLCPASHMCPLAEKGKAWGPCYAMGQETQRPSYLIANERNRLVFQLAMTDNDVKNCFFNMVIAYIKYINASVAGALYNFYGGNGKPSIDKLDFKDAGSTASRIRFIRISEAGDMFDDHSIEFWDEFATKIKSEFRGNVRVYAYSARKDLDFSKLNDLVVNGSWITMEGDNIRRHFVALPDEMYFALLSSSFTGEFKPTGRTLNGGGIKNLENELLNKGFDGDWETNDKGERIASTFKAGTSIPRVRKFLSSRKGKDVFGYYYVCPCGLGADGGGVDSCDQCRACFDLNPALEVDDNNNETGKVVRDYNVFIKVHGANKGVFKMNRNVNAFHLKYGKNPDTSNFKNDDDYLLNSTEIGDKLSEVMPSNNSGVRHSVIPKNREKFTVGDDGRTLPEYIEHCKQEFASILRNNKKLSELSPEEKQELFTDLYGDDFERGDEFSGNNKR